MKVFGISLSPYVRKVLLVCEIKQLDYEHAPVMPGNNDAEFRRASPFGKVPALIDGELKVSDSSVICDYLEDNYPAVPTQPKPLELRARARWYEEFADTLLIDAMSPFFFERMVKNLFLETPVEADEERLKQVAAELVPKTLGYLEQEVPDAGYLFGETIGCADIALLSPTVNAAYADFHVDAATWPRCAAYFERLRAHPVVARVLAAEQTSLDAIRQA